MASSFQKKALNRKPAIGLGQVESRNPYAFTASKPEGFGELDAFGNGRVIVE